jgi:hypothetical protein
MLQKLFFIFMLTYFVLGTLLLPQGDFAALADLPRMYQHCKDTEDPDMDIPDFIVEHLMQIDDDMGEAEDSDKGERPHQPVQFNHLSAPVSITVRQVAIKIVLPTTDKRDKLIISNDVYLSDYPASVFRPPIIG